MQRILTSLILSLLCCAVAHAQTYPARPINLIIPFAAGGPTDLLGRTLAAKLTDVIGQRVIVENRPGAGGSVAAEYTIRSAPDGYTIMLITVGTQTINPFVFAKIGYDPLKDFSYITTIGNYELVLLVNPNTPQKTLTELIAYGKANPDKMNFGSGGVGTTSHLAGELFSKSQGIKAQHAPYKGGAQRRDCRQPDLSVRRHFNRRTAGRRRTCARAGRERAQAVCTATRRSDHGRTRHHRL